MKKPQRTPILFNIVFYICFFLIAYLLYDKSAPRKWEPAIMWTCVTFGVAIEIHRWKWKIVSFWISVLLLFLVHSIFMWIIFSLIPPAQHSYNRVLTIPLAFLEGLCFLALIPWLQNIFTSLVKQNNFD